MKDKVGSPIGSPFSDSAVPGSSYTAMTMATITPGGSVLVDCPYCKIFWRSSNPVDVTKFVDAAGKKEVKVYCSKGHTLKFRSIPEWQEARIKQGVHKPL